MEVTKHIDSIQDMLVTELICLQNIRANAEARDDSSIMNDFQKLVVGRLMRRTLNQIPAYKVGSMKPEKNFDLQKDNLKRLLYQRTIKNMAFLQSNGKLSQATNDIEFADNIFKYIDEYDNHIKKIKDPKNMNREHF